MTSVLWVSSEPPDFTVGGGAVRQAQLLKGLSPRVEGVDLLLAGRLSDPDVRRQVRSVLEVAVPALAPPSSLARRRVGDLWKTFALRTPAEAHDRREDRRALSRALLALPAQSAAAYDVVHVEHLGLAGVVPPSVPGLRSLDVQNIPSRMAAQALALETGRRQQFLRRGELAAARRFQSSAVASTDFLSVVSAEDSADLGADARPPATVAVVPNGVDLDRFPVTELPNAPSLVFTGTLDFQPNTEGIRWFVTEVFPRVRDRRPDATLDIVGRRPPGAVAALARVPGVALHSDVEDVVPFLAAARVVVVPLRIGSGSRLKVLEAMAAQRPVVSTSVGVEGLSVVPGRDALVADDPPAMAEKIVALCGDAERADELARSGRRLVEESYQWERIAADYADALLGALSNRRSQSA